MSINFITIGLVYIIIGFTSALIFYYIFRWTFIGKIWGAIIVGVAASFLGGFADALIINGRFLTFVLFSVNIIPPWIISILFLYVFHRITNSPEE